MNDEPYSKFFMEYNIDLKIQNPRLNEKYNCKIYKKCDNKSRMAARKICNIKKHTRRRKRIKLKQDTKAMVTDICEYC